MKLKDVSEGIQARTQRRPRSFESTTDAVLGTLYDITNRDWTITAQHFYDTQFMAQFFRDIEEGMQTRLERELDKQKGR